jgi:hypothetical protein
MDRGRSHRKRNGNKNSVSNTDGLSGGGAGGEGTLTDPDPFAVFAVDFMVPPLETSKSTATSKSTSVRRESGWRNFEDYTCL